jgi:hypothetical protein
LETIAHRARQFYSLFMTNDTTRTCLQCGAKLSLLKVVAGQTYCSPQHADLHQEEEFRRVFARLMEFTGTTAVQQPTLVAEIH